MPTYTLGSLVEIGIPNDKVKKFKSTKKLEEYLHEQVDKVYSNLTTINGFEVLHSYAKDAHDYVEINDFRYSYSNKCEKNKDLKVYRIFPKDDVIIVDTHLLELEGSDLFGEYRYSMGKLTVDLTISMRKPFDPKPNVLKEVFLDTE